jgi:hypothetical protein
MPRWMRLRGVVARGHRVASGRAEDSPYPTGTIEMQTPFFIERGLDLRPFHPATIGVSCRPLVFGLNAPEYTFRSVKWLADHPAEDFSFSRCRLLFEGKVYDGLVYYPHPDTKIGHFHDSSTLEVIAPFIEGIDYGVEVDLEINTEEIAVCDD